MDKILEMAREIGLLIRDTDVYRRYDRAGRLLRADSQASGILERFYSLSSEIETRRKMGDIVEEYEIGELGSLRDELNRSEVVMEFLIAEKGYADLLIKIQEELKSAE